MSEIIAGLGSLVALEAGTDGVEAWCVIRVGVGERRIAVGTDFTVWAMVMRMPRTRDDMLDHIERMSGTDPTLPKDAAELEACLERLHDSALAVGIDEGSAWLADLALRVRLVPLHRALPEVTGTGPDVPIGSASREVVSLDPQRAKLWGQLDSVESVARIAVGRATVEGREADDDDMYAAFSECIDLVLLGAAYFDAAI